MLLLVLFCVFLVLNFVHGMEYVDICFDDQKLDCVKMSRLIMGTDHLGKLPDEELFPLFDETIKLGINAFDTSPIYIDSIENRLGQWLKQRADRDDIVVFTKGGFPKDYNQGKDYVSRLKVTKEDIVTNILEEEIPHSLNNLGKIDVYLMHRDDEDYINHTKVEREQTPVKTILEALSDERLSKNYRTIGLSNWVTERVEKSQEEAKNDKSLLRPVFNSPYFSLLEMSEVSIHQGGKQVLHKEMMDPNFQKGVIFMPYSPLGGFSVLSRGWENAKKIALALSQEITVEVWDHHYWMRVYESIFHDANWKRYKRANSFILDFNKKHDTTYSLDQLFNAYALAHTRMDCLIIGPTSIAKLERSVDSLELAKLLTQDDLDYLYNNDRHDDQQKPGIDTFTVVVLVIFIFVAFAIGIGIGLGIWGIVTFIRSKMKSANGLPKQAYVQFDKK